MDLEFMALSRYPSTVPLVKIPGCKIYLSRVAAVKEHIRGHGTVGAPAHDHRLRKTSVPPYRWR